jgi:hypothetical protein
LNFAIYILTIFLFAPASGLDSIREAYFSGAKTEESAIEFNAMMAETDLVTPTHKAYYGAALALKAKYGQNVREKKEYFVAAVENIEDAIKAEPNNIEIRLIRLSVQENSPRIVRYKTNMDEDKAMILEGFDRLSTTVKRCVQDYVSNSEFFTKEEKERVLN